MAPVAFVGEVALGEGVEMGGEKDCEFSCWECVCDMISKASRRFQRSLRLMKLFMKSRDDDSQPVRSSKMLEAETTFCSHLLS